MCRIGGPGHELLLGLGPDLPLIHQLGHGVLAHALTLGDKGVIDSGTAVNAAVLFVHPLDPDDQFLAALRSFAGWTKKPRVVTRPADLKNPAAKRHLVA